MRAFQRRYRDVDMLLIEHIQFLENRERTQEEFFHAFNTLNNPNKQIVNLDSSPVVARHTGRAGPEHHAPLCRTENGKIQACRSGWADGARLSRVSEWAIYLSTAIDKIIGGNGPPQAHGEWRLTCGQA